MPQPTSQQRRRCIRWYFAHSKDVPATCAQFGISRATLYRWLAQYAAAPEKPLRAQSRRPHRTRQPTWTLGDLCLLSDLVLDHPQATRRQLQRRFAALTGVHCSETTVGRMLRVIAQRCPRCARKHHQHVWRRHFAAHLDQRQGGHGMYVRRPRREEHGDSAPEMDWLLEQAEDPDMLLERLEREIEVRRILADAARLLRGEQPRAGDADEDGGPETEPMP